jgi:Ras-related protein Rab-5C
MKRLLSFREKFSTLLKNVHLTIGSQLHAVIITDQDGLVIASDTSEDFNEKVLGGLAVLVMPVIDRIEQEIGTEEKFGIGTFNTGIAQLMFCKAGPQAIVILAGNLYASLDTLFPYCYLLAEKVARILNDENVSLKIPNFIQESQQLHQGSGFKRIYIEHNHYSLKIVLLGEFGVGKTSIVRQFVENKFQANYQETIGISIMNRNIRFPEWDLKFEYMLYDIAGQSIFTHVRHSYINGAIAGFIIFDVTRPETFNKAKVWYQDCKNIEPDIQLVLIGNKIDLKEQRKITTEDGVKLAKELGITYIETSATDYELITDTFRTLGLLLIKNKWKLQSKKMEYPNVV